MEQQGGRQKRVTGKGKGVHRRGEGLHTSGPVGRSDGYQGRGGANAGGGQRSSGSGGSGLKLIILLVLLLLGGGGGGAALLGGGDSGPGEQQTVSTQETGGQQTASSTASSGASLLGMLSGFTGSNATSDGWKDGTGNTGNLNRMVDAAAREKRVIPKGNSTDTITFMIYMCGTDLESRASMASNDIAEMCSASLSDQINILIYTGGCKDWKTQGISNSVNQIYKVENGSLKRLVESDGARRMTDPATLTDFIRWCHTNYPADRNNLIFWDHGGGSLSGYGYDEKFPGGGSMDLAGINTALKNANVTFDFIGFDACLMATLETALMLDPYADYLIASEETEPGIGWYYTNWLTELSANTSMDTIEIGKLICDDFVKTCALRCQGQKTTLSVIDLAELSRTVPERLSEFSTDTAEMIQGDEYAAVSDARVRSREFATSSRIDQIDLVNFALNIGSEEARALSDKLLSAVKYNRTSSNMTNAYGISIYFPYQKTGKVGQAVSTYNRIGLGEEYAKCIQSFAGLEQSGQLASGGSGSPLGSLMNISGGSYSAAAPAMGSDAIGALLGAFLTGGRSLPGEEDMDRAVMQDESVFDVSQAADYVAGHQFDASKLVWEVDEEGNHLLSLSDEDWALIHSLQVNMFYDDGEGSVDLGLDNLYTFDDGKLVGDTDNTWLSIDGQPVAFYYEDTIRDNGKETVTGRVPALLNGERVNLILVFDEEHPYGCISGARYDYVEGETETAAKSFAQLTESDEIVFLCDFYSYDGRFEDSYQLGDKWMYHEDAEISNTDVGGHTVITYLLTDLYNREFWTPALQQ